MVSCIACSEVDQPIGLVKEFVHWTVVTGIDQQRIGTLNIVAKSHVLCFEALPRPAAAELFSLVARLEAVLMHSFGATRVDWRTNSFASDPVHLPSHLTLNVVPCYYDAPSDVVRGALEATRGQRPEFVDALCRGEIASAIASSL